MKIPENRPGGLRETLAVSLPLMLASLSMYLMYFVERSILACFSLDALNAAVQASSLSWALWGGVTVLAGMAEVFVAQFNGMGHHERMGQAVWQMIWFSLMATALIIPIGVASADLIYPPNSDQANYFRWSMLSGFFQPFSYALTTFFVGQGKTKWVLILTLFIGTINALLDYLLIFGIEGYLPSQGAMGAALANGMSSGLQTALLFVLFLRRSHRQKCGTSLWKPRLNILWRSIRIAAPTAILYNIELWGWGLFYIMMASASPMHITISSLCQSLIYLFTFIGEGLYRGTLMKANHYLVTGKNQLIKRVFLSAIFILVICFLLQIVALWINPHVFLHSIIPMNEEMVSFFPALKICTWLVFIHLLFQGVQWLLAGMLCAKGETFSMMIVGSIGLVTVLLIPTYCLIEFHSLSIEWAWTFVVLYSVLSCLAYLVLLVRARRKPPIAGYICIP